MISFLLSGFSAGSCSDHYDSDETMMVMIMLIVIMIMIIIMMTIMIIMNHLPEPSNPNNTTVYLLLNFATRFPISLPHPLTLAHSRTHNHTTQLLKTTAQPT